MDGLDLTKYTNQKKTKAPNSARAEQIDKATKIVNKEFKQIAGLTRKLTVEQIFLLNKESKGGAELWWYLLQNKYMDRTKNADYKLVKEKLEKHIEFREREKRDPFLSLLALRKIGVNASINQLVYYLSLVQLAEYAVKFGSYARMWRAVMEDNEQLRGKVYLSKEQEEALVKNKMGYK